MAITITGTTPVTTVGKHVYNITGSELDDTKPIQWFGDDTCELKVGDWTDETKPVNMNNPKKITMIVPNDHYDTRDFKLYANVWNKTTKASELVTFDGHYTINVGPSVTDYTFKAGIPTGEASFTRPEFYAIHESDNPPVNTVTTPFFTTYPSNDRNYEHVITYSGDSSFFWDSGQNVVHKPIPSGGKIESTMSVHDWAPHGDYTGYTTVSVVGSVVHHTGGNDEDPKVTIAQDGYRIFIEYHTGTAIKVRVLRAKSNTEELLVTKENKAIETHGSND